MKNLKINTNIKHYATPTVALKLVKVQDINLHVQAQTLVETDDIVDGLAVADRLVDIAKIKNLKALAAPHVGLSANIFVIGNSEFVNAEIIGGYGYVLSQEKTHLYDHINQIPRWQAVDVVFVCETGGVRAGYYEGPEAIAYQQMIDAVNGITPGTRIEYITRKMVAYKNDNPDTEDGIPDELYIEAAHPRLLISNILGGDIENNVVEIPVPTRPMELLGTPYGTELPTDDTAETA